MVEEICDLLRLDRSAGLGWRLQNVTIEPDLLQSQGFTVKTEDIVEALTLAEALNARARTLKVNTYFRPTSC